MKQGSTELSHINSGILAVEEEHPQITGINLQIAQFRWKLEDQDFAIYDDLENETPIKLNVWRHTGFVSLNGILKSGVKITENITAKNKYGNLVNSTKVSGHLYAYDALAHSLSSLGVPITAKECKAMVEEAKERGIRFGILIRLSDLAVTSPEKYKEMGKVNGWKIISNSQSNMLYRDYQNQVIDQSLRESGSKIRRKKNVKWKAIID